MIRALGNLGSKDTERIVCVALEFREPRVSPLPHTLCPTLREDRATALLKGTTNEDVVLSAVEHG